MGFKMEKVPEIFISYVEEDGAVAKELADGLEENGFACWYYERDSVPGESYLLTTGNMIESCKAIILVISSKAIQSHQMSREVERAHECRKKFIPILVDLNHVDFISRQPMWRQALGTTASIRIPAGGVKEIVPKIIKGIQAPTALEMADPSSKVAQVLGSKVFIERPSIFIFGHKPSTASIHGRDSLVEGLVNRLTNKRCEFLCLYGAVGVGKSTVASLLFSGISRDPETRFRSFIWYDLRNESDPETALIHIATVATGGNIAQDILANVGLKGLLNIIRNADSSNPTLLVFDNLDSTFAKGKERGHSRTSDGCRFSGLLRVTDSAVITTSQQQAECSMNSPLNRRRSMVCPPMNPSICCAMPACRIPTMCFSKRIICFRDIPWRFPPSREP